MGKRARVARVALGVLAGVAAGALVPAGDAGAAGITTHAWMALEAIDLVEDPRLQALLAANVEQVRGGAQFPDGGYWPGNTYGEEAHWQRFHDAYAERILARDDCAELTDPTGPCAPLVAHLMGAIAHGMGDQTWDWLFEPNSPDLDEYYLPPEWAPIAGPGGQELQLDLIAIADHGQPLHPIPAPPSEADLLAAFDAAGFVGATPASLANGLVGLNTIKLAEEILAAQHADNVRAAMPWMSANVVDAPGGVRFSAVAIAGAMDSMWGRLLGDQPRTEVSITYPAHGARRIPSGGWVRTFIAGSNPGSGGARTRITAALTSARPYVPSAAGPGTVPRQLPPGAMTLTEVDTGSPVPVMAGWPRSVPYAPDAGEHLVDIQPAADLAPCTWYEAGVTEALVDARGLPVEAMTWRFRTGADAAGSRCPDDPYLPGDPLDSVGRFVTSAYRDLLHREPALAELSDAAAAVVTSGRAAFADALVASAAHRQLLVSSAYAVILGRQPTGDELAHWSGWLATHSLADLADALFADPEAYAAAGSSADGFVTTMYRAFLGRDPDAGELAAWRPWVPTEAARRAVVQFVAASAEAAGTAVAAEAQRLLGRQPTPAEHAWWTAVVQATGDTRPLWTAVLGSDEYFGGAQQ